MAMEENSLVEWIEIMMNGDFRRQSRYPLFSHGTNHPQHDLSIRIRRAFCCNHSSNVPTATPAFLEIMTLFTPFYIIYIYIFQLLN